MLRSRSNSVSVVQIGISFLESKFDEDLFKKSHSKGINHTISNHISLRVLELLFGAVDSRKNFIFHSNFGKSTIWENQLLYPVCSVQKHKLYLIMLLDSLSFTHVFYWSLNFIYYF